VQATGGLLTNMGAAQTIARVREKENTIRALEAAVADLEIQREEHRKLALVADAEKTNVARQGRANDIFQ